jgi:penicillin-binding protein 1A
MSYRHRQARLRRRRPRFGSRFGLGISVVALLGLVVLLSGIGYVAATVAQTPDIDEVPPLDKGESSLIFAADGSRLGYVQSDEIRTPVPNREIPRRLRQAAVAIEDERFFEHEGVDYEAIARAGVKNLSEGQTLQGGSTITQQLARALYIRDAERNVDRKIREAKLATDLEERRSKRWILREYLNSVPYGTINGKTALGVEAAAETYFSKHARDLTLGESALLAGLPQAPSQYNPLRSPSAARERRNEVLGQMARLGYISVERAERESRKPLRLDRGDRYTKRREPYFFDYVSEKLIEQYGASAYRRGGLKVYTTVNPKLQEAGRQAIQDKLFYPGDPSSAIVSIDPANGYIRAMAASGTYDERTFNLAAQGKRQPGRRSRPSCLPRRSAGASTRRRRTTTPSR